MDSATARKLWAIHWPREPGSPDPDAGQRAGPGVFLDTCLRRLLFGVGPRPHADPTAGGAGQQFLGVSAYRLLLEITSGLRSAVPGETNVFGQFRRAWQLSADRLPTAELASLRPVVDDLLADTRTIRREHLQGVGGNSYGSLARRLLAPDRNARVLFIGAGDLARSMLPFFRSNQLGVWNHRPTTVVAGIDRWFAAQSADEAAAWAEHIILTTPCDADHDEAWSRRLGHGGVRSLVHLGRRRTDPWPVCEATRAYDLDDIFALARERENVRSLQLARARAACAELAALRFRPASRPDDRAATRPARVLTRTRAGSRS